LGSSKFIGKIPEGIPDLASVYDKVTVTPIDPTSNLGEKINGR